MNLYEIEGTEADPVYQEMAASNNTRHYDFLISLVRAAIGSNRPWLSETLIKAINFHAIVGLHYQAGQYRSHEVTVGSHDPPPHYRVQSLMEDFVNEVNWHWQSTGATQLASYALWKLNNIHPFVNGNGRTARAVCYFILCVKSGGPLGGTVIVPEIIRQEPMRTAYLRALQAADAGDLSHLNSVIAQAVMQQLTMASDNIEHSP